jgi:hypothetical protein
MRRLFAAGVSKMGFLCSTGFALVAGNVSPMPRSAFGLALMASSVVPDLKAPISMADYAHDHGFSPWRSDMLVLSPC